MFRSSLTTAISGFGSGIVAVVATDKPSPIEAALAALLTACAVAITDHFARKRLNRLHEAKFLREHRLTRAAVRGKTARRRHRRKPKKGAKNHG